MKTGYPLETALDGFLRSKCIEFGIPEFTDIYGPARIEGKKVMRDFLSLISPLSIMEIENAMGASGWTIVGASVAYRHPSLPQSLAMSLSDFARRDVARALRTVPVTRLDILRDEPLVYQITFI